MVRRTSSRPMETKNTYLVAAVCSCVKKVGREDYGK